MDRESLAQIRQIVTEVAQGVREEMAVLGTDLRSEITDTKRHMGVLTEGLRHELQLVAEAVQLQSERLSDVRREVEIQATETGVLQSHIRIAARAVERVACMADLSPRTHSALSV